ncbi:MAG: hypothetical protein GY714_22095 [Desulfobacterales bacterium]|nr:hypothetical protein [Desulfobacterales bacterium]MCP4160402.1 hypothetical protein [Deltaproteobacteria bacterium]
MQGFRLKQNRKNKNLRFKNRRNRFSQQLRCRGNDNQPKGDLLNSKFERFENSEQKNEDEDE